MKTEFTKGEWVAEPFKKGISNGYINVNYPLGFITLYGVTVDTQDPDLNAIAEAEANAKLIAAAPDLLNALVLLKDKIQMYYETRTGFIDDLKQLKIAQEAIKKATE